MANNFNSAITITFEDQSDAAQSLGKIQSFSGIDGSAGDTDITTFGSGTYKEYAQGMADGGSITIGVIRDFDNVGQAAVLASLTARSTREMVITFPSGTINTVTVSGHVNSFDADGADIDGVLLGTISFKISGPPVYSAV